MTAGLRQRLFHRLKPTEAKDNSIIRIQGIDFSRVFDKAYTKIKREYLEFLRTTKFIQFILCPRGYGIGTVRLFESMKTARVPVISDRYTLPAGIDWKTCSVRIRETELDRIPEILHSKLQEWPDLARRARINWEQNFSNDHFFGYLVKNLEEMLGSLPTASLARQADYAMSIASQLAADRLRPVFGRMRSWLGTF